MSAINREDLLSETTDHTEENDDDDELSDVALCIPKGIQCV